MHLLHVSMIISDLTKSADFYENILGLEPDLRPDLGFTGLFYKLGGNQQLHLMCVHNPYQDCQAPKHGGRDRHIALAVGDLQQSCEKMDQSAIPYTLSRSGRRALFCHDPDGNVVELCEVNS
ncbi:MAG: VOC family protein [Mariprofundaceae bacterium]|nr:VOC family protein [Mariprofundaceae bacterium]